MFKQVLRNNKLWDVYIQLLCISIFLIFLGTNIFSNYTKPNSKKDSSNNMDLKNIFAYSETLKDLKSLEIHLLKK